MTAPLRILIVDDDEVDRMAVRRALKGTELSVEFSEANSGQMAIAALQTNAFDCIFLDYRLPDMTGLALVQEFRGAGIRIPLLVLTGQGDEQIAVDLMKAGASDYLNKSRISAEVLTQLLRNSIRIYQAEQRAEQANQQLREKNKLLTRQNQQLEQQRQQIQLQNLKLLEASRLKSQFLATMSHELRTPMNAIIGFSQMLLRPSKGQLSAQQTDMVQRILNNGKNLLALLNDVLDLSKIEAGRLDLNPESFNLMLLITNTIAELQSLAAQKSLRLEVAFNLADPILVQDANRLRQVLVNLLSNAIKFTDVGQVTITVNETCSDRIAIEIADTGIGIAAENLEHIFEAFRQVDQTATRRHPGTGLGLAITESLVQLMQGRITVESTIGEGSTFRVEVPRFYSAGENSNPTVSATETGPTSAGGSVGSEARLCDADRAGEDFAPKLMLRGMSRQIVRVSSKD